MRKIEWIDEERIIPEFGIIGTGDLRVMPDDMAAAFIRQGQARAPVIKKEKKEKEV